MGRVFILFGLKISYGIMVFFCSFKNCVFQVSFFDCQAPIKVGEDLFCSKVAEAQNLNRLEKSERKQLSK